MKRLLTATTMALFLLFLIPALCFSAYLIHLKDGGQFTTDRYWEEGDQIKFKRFGGQVGIPKELVKKIEVVEIVEDIPDQEEKPAAGRRADEQLPQEKPKAPASSDVSAQDNKQKKSDPIEEKGEKEDQGSERETPHQVTDEGKKKAEKEEAAKIDAFLEAKRRILADRARIVLAYKDARTQNNKEEKEKLRQKLLEIQKRLSKLRDEVKANNEGQLPAWWEKVK